ncbi:MAG: tripartite tricarboxylate transporter TctB family protein [Thermodesulfobacteriota bacterium]
MDKKDLREFKNKRDQESAAGDFIIGLVLLSLSVFIIFESIRMPQKGRWGFFMGPGFLPLILGFVLIGLSGYLILRSLTSNGQAGIILLFRKMKEGVESRRFLIIAGWTAIYVALIGTIPFLLINFIYFFGIFLYLKVGRLWEVILLSIGASLLVGFITPRIFDMPLP